MSCGSRKLLVCGSRTIRDTTYIKGPTQWAKNQIDAYWYYNLACYDELIMIEGAAKGIDTIAKEYAQENDWKIEEYPAEWDKYGKSAGYIRNELMVKAADEVLILWDGESKGTKHDIDLCEKYNKPYVVLIYNDKVKETYVEKYLKENK
jgi:hypothetical protein